MEVVNDTPAVRFTQCGESRFETRVGVSWSVLLDSTWVREEVQPPSADLLLCDSPIFRFPENVGRSAFYTEGRAFETNIDHFIDPSVIRLSRWKGVQS